MDYLMLGHNLSRPSFLYVLGFFICSIVAYSWKTEWDLHTLSPTTAFLLIGGAILFFVVELLYSRCHPMKRRYTGIEYDNNFVPIKCKKLYIFLILQIAVYCVVAKAKMQQASLASTLAESLLEANNDKKFNGIFSQLPFYINSPYVFCQDIGFIWCALLPYYQMKSKLFRKQKLLIACNFIVCLLGSFLSAGRMPMFNYIVSYFSFLYISYQFKSRWKNGLLPKKYSILILGGCITFVLFFNQLGYVIGRQEDDRLSTSALIAMYCGAEIKNLDDAIKYPATNNKDNLFAQYTLCTLYNHIALRQNPKSPKLYGPPSEFNHVNGYYLGNVYTTYYNYWLDFGCFGLLCVVLVAFFMSFLYHEMINSIFWVDGRLSLWICIYSYMSVVSFLSFFSEQFFSHLPILAIIRMPLYWLIMIIYFQGYKNNYHKKILNKIMYRNG